MNKTKETEMEERFKVILRTSIIGIIANVALGIVKAIVGLAVNSIAITMDAVNNFTDSGSSLITIVSTKYAGKEPDKKHPFGYGRSEYLGTLLIAGLILYAGVTAFIEAVTKIIHPEEADYSTVSLIIIALAVIVKISLGLFTTKSGQKVNSDSLIASGKDALGDAVISAATVFAALLFIFAGISVEAWLAAIISIIIIKSGIETLMETVSKILGDGADAELVRSIKKTIVNHKGVKGAYDLILNNYGPDSYYASVHIEVEDTISANEFDQLSRKIEESVYKEHSIVLTAVGLYSINTRDDEIVQMRQDVTKIVNEIEHVNQLHGFYANIEEKQIRFDLVISFEAESRRAVHDQAVEAVQKQYPGYNIHAGLDCDFNEI